MDQQEEQTSSVEPTVPEINTPESPEVSSPVINTAAWKEQRRKLKEEKLEAKRKLKRLKELQKNNPVDMERFQENYIKTHGNATEAAVLTWGYTNRALAGSRGTDYVRRMKNDPMILALMEEQGLTMGKFIETLAKKIEESKTPEWWDRGMAMRPDGRDFLKKEGGSQVGIINIVEAQKKILSEYGEVEEVEEATEGEVIEEETEGSGESITEGGIDQEDTASFSNDL